MITDSLGNDVQLGLLNGRLGTGPRCRLPLLQQLRSDWAAHASAAGGAPATGNAHVAHAAQQLRMRRLLCGLLRGLLLQLSLLRCVLLLHMLLQGLLLRLLLLLVLQSRLALLLLLLVRLQGV
jgi:hypothetical protein